MELFLRFETSSCRAGPPVVRDSCGGIDIGFQFAFSAIATHASFQVTNQRTKQATYSQPSRNEKQKKKKERKRKKRKREVKKKKKTIGTKLKNWDDTGSINI